MIKFELVEEETKISVIVATVEELVEKNWVENVGIKILVKKVFVEIFCSLSNTLYLNQMFLS